MRVATDHILVTHNAALPDRVKIERYFRTPELGPKLLFFSGGTALRQLSQRLINYTHNSIHLITSFDSGGSSAKLRQAFNMLSIGDLRNRIMALADLSVQGNHEVYDLFAHRLPADGTPDSLATQLEDMVQGRNELVFKIPQPMRSIICNHLGYMIKQMPSTFDLRGASIGNLVLTGGYLNNNRDIDAVIFLFSKLVQARGLVKPITEGDTHLTAVLNDGSHLVGQHRITSNNQSRIREIYLSDYHGNETNDVAITPMVHNLISSADLICYPIGSFFTSLLANLIPEGVSDAIAGNPNPKVFIPNPAGDPEQSGMSLVDVVDTLLSYAGNHCRKNINQVLNYIVLDSKNIIYPGKLNLNDFILRDIQVIDTTLTTNSSHPYINPELLLNTLLSLT